MQKFIISVKEKTIGRDVLPPYIVNSLDGLGNYSERISSLGRIVTGKQRIIGQTPLKKYSALFPKLNTLF